MNRTEASLSSQDSHRAAALTLWFAEGQHIELVSTDFYCPLLVASGNALGGPAVAFQAKEGVSAWRSVGGSFCEVRAVRGKTIGAFQATVTFQWTAAVQALAVLLLNSVAENANGNCEYVLTGGAGSLAASLDAAILKRSSWLDLFGWDSNGQQFCTQVICRSNPGLRRLGPVAMALNREILAPNAVAVHVGNKRVTDCSALIEYASDIESQWASKRQQRDQQATLQCCTMSNVIENQGNIERQLRLPGIVGRR